MQLPEHKAGTSQKVCSGGKAEQEAEEEVATLQGATFPVDREDSPRTSSSCKGQLTKSSKQWKSNTADILSDKWSPTGLRPRRL